MRQHARAQVRSSPATLRSLSSPRASRAHPVLSLIIALLFTLAAPRPSMAAAIDIDSLWNFDAPAQSEAHFRAALAGADADQTFILQTQIARTYGLRGQFAQAGQVLDALQPGLAHASPEGQVRYYLERGRTLASAVAVAGGPSPDMVRAARADDDQAYRLASRYHLDALAVDALHMMAFVDTAPADQLRWDERALALALNSSDPKAQHWEASLRNNMGNALNDLNRHPEALDQFRLALALRERAGNDEASRDAWSSVGWTLRLMGRNAEALAIQQRVLAEEDAMGETDPDVLEEIADNYRALGNDAAATIYESRRRAFLAAHPDAGQ